MDEFTPKFAPSILDPRMYHCTYNCLSLYLRLPVGAGWPLDK